MSLPYDYDGDDEDIDGPTLKDVVERGCKKLHIGAAVLPKPLFIHDVDEIDDDEEDRANMESAATTPSPYREYMPPFSGSSNNINRKKNSNTQLDQLQIEGNVNPEYDLATTRYAKVLRNEFNAIVIEHHLKWKPLCQTQPGPIDDKSPSNRMGRYDFHYTDLIVDWAMSQNMAVKGHVLCWHVTSPSFLEQMSSQQIKEQLKRHIFTTIGHYKGRIKIWDVVNESLAPDGSLAENIFYKKLGPSYIEMAFRWAHEADPSATLLYNDNQVEGMNGPNAAKADAFYNLLSDLKAKDVPVHGCGMQAHFNAAGTGKKRVPTPYQIKNQIHRLGKLGLTVNISEMDVRVSKLPANLRQIAQKQIYHDVVAACISEPMFDGIWLWGFTDRHTWVTHFYYDDEPLVFDEEYGRKDSYYGLRDALSTLCVGGVVGGGPNSKVLLDADYDEDGNPWGYLWQQPEQPPKENTVEEGAALATGDDKPDWLHEPV